MTGIELDSGDGALILHTTREGMAGRIGHDLTILVSDWTAALTLEGDRVSSLKLQADVASLQVVEGRGGLKPLSDGDRKSIVDNAQKTLRAKDFPHIVFEATGSVPAPSAGSVGSVGIAGMLTIAGVRRPLAVTVKTEQVATGTRATADVEVTQSDFGIKPYSAMLGQLKVADVVRLTLDVVVPTAG